MLLGCCLLLWFLPLGENVPVGAAVLHGDTISTVWRIVAYSVEWAILIIIGHILQYCCIPNKAKAAIFHLNESETEKEDIQYSAFCVYLIIQLESYRVSEWSWFLWLDSQFNK